MKRLCRLRAARASRPRSPPTACCPWAISVRSATVPATPACLALAPQARADLCDADDDVEEGASTPLGGGGGGGGSGAQAGEAAAPGSNPMKPGEGIDPANYTGAGDADYFKKQFQKQQKRNQKKAAAEAQAKDNATLALAAAAGVAVLLFFYSSGVTYTPTTAPAFPPTTLGAQLAVKANHGWLLAVALISTVLLQHAAMQAAAARKQ
jgi:lysylphosphatidylglycerol synthetase-like protein (DUF2156 family)